MVVCRSSKIAYYTLFLVFLVPLLIRAQEGSISETGVIRGRVVISRADDVTEEIMRGRMLNRYETRSDQSEKPFQPYTLSEKAVVYIESVPGNYTPPKNHPTLDQRDMVFRPLVLPILVGTSVDFPNSDPLFHNVFSLSEPKEFDLGRYAQGQHRSLTFDKEGVVSVYCEIHSYMFATILVLQNPYFARPDQDGDFEIGGVPPGTYQLNFWYGRKKADGKTITVAPRQTTSVNFQY
jgi:plastocyanin